MTVQETGPPTTESGAPGADNQNSEQRGAGAWTVPTSTSRRSHSGGARSRRPYLPSPHEALHALTGSGLVRGIEPAGSPARFEGCVGDHHHVVCRSCGVVAAVDCPVGEAPCLTASDDHGFSIDEAEVIHWGLCPGCSTARSA